MAGAQDNLPYVTVVVPALNAETELAACLTSLARLEYPAERHEVVVVDNGSSDGTADLVHVYPFRCMREPRRGVAYARNAGIRAARGDVIAFTDTDCTVSTGWLSLLAGEFEDPSVGAVAGAIIPFPPETEAQRYAARRLSHSQLRPLSHQRPFGMTPNLAVRRDPLLRIGAFDVRFPGGGFEDADLCWRLGRETDLRLVYAPEAVAFHRYRGTARDFLVQHYRYGYGLRLLRDKYPDEVQWGRVERRRAYGDLVDTACIYLQVSAHGALRRMHAHGRSAAKFDLLRLAGQRSGFLAAGLAARATGPSRSGTHLTVAAGDR